MISEKQYKRFNCTRNFTRDEVKNTFGRIKRGLEIALKKIEQSWAEFGGLGDETDNCRNLAALFSSLDVGIGAIMMAIEKELKKPYLNMGE